MGEENAKPDEIVARIASRQHGVASVRQLRAAGLGRNAVARRVQAGRLHRVHRGVYAVGHKALSPEGHRMAAILAGGCAFAAEAGNPGRGSQAVLDYWGAALSHRSAAEHWALLSPADRRIEITIVGTAGREKRKGIRIRRSLTLLPADVTLRSGIPVTTVARTLADLRKVVSPGKGPGVISPHELRRAIRQANVLGLPVDEETSRERTRSDLERDFLRLCCRNDLPEPEVNVRVGGHLVDFLWRDRKLVVETDGYRYHRGRVAFEDDRARDLALRAAGYDVVHLADRQLSAEPERIVRVLREHLRHVAP